jgi:uncharacterized small protein (DUF1192 family)
VPGAGGAGPGACRAFLLYVVTVSRRLGAVQRDVERLEADIKARK